MDSQWWGGSVCWIPVVWWPASESSSGNTRTMRDTVCKSKMHNTWVTIYILCPPQHDSHVCTLIHICMLHTQRNGWSTSKAYLSKQQKVIRKLGSLHGVYFKNPSSFFLIFNFFDPTQPPESYFTSCFAYQYHQSFLLKTPNMILLLALQKAPFHL